jgi:hypothetical protein
MSLLNEYVNEAKITNSCIAVVVYQDIALQGDYLVSTFPLEYVLLTGLRSP